MLTLEDPSAMTASAAEVRTDAATERVADGTFMVMAESHWTGREYAWHLEHRGISIEDSAAKFLRHAEGNPRRKGFMLTELSRLPDSLCVFTIEDAASAVVKDGGEYGLIGKHLIPAACLEIVKHLIPEDVRRTMTHLTASEYLAQVIGYWPEGCDQIILMSEAFWVDDTPRRMRLWKDGNQVKLNAGGSNGTVSKKTTIFAFAAAGRR